MDYELEGTWEEVKPFPTLLEGQRKIEENPSVRIFGSPTDIGTLSLYKTNSRTPEATCLATRCHNPKYSSMCLHKKMGTTDAI